MCFYSNPYRAAEGNRIIKVCNFAFDGRAICKLKILRITIQQNVKTRSGQRIYGGR